MQLVTDTVVFIPQSVVVEGIVRGNTIAVNEKDFRRGPDTRLKMVLFCSECKALSGKSKLEYSHRKVNKTSLFDH